MLPLATAHMFSLQHTTATYSVLKSNESRKECLTGLLPFDVPSDTRTVMDKVDAIAEQACSMEEVTGIFLETSFTHYGPHNS